MAIAYGLKRTKGLGCRIPTNVYSSTQVKIQLRKINTVIKRKDIVKS